MKRTKIAFNSNIQQANINYETDILQQFNK